jgi:aminoglycoside phosphotransferase (APT) family kinase protein
VIPEGHSGFTYWVDLDGRRAVMRLPPPGARIAGPADIPRQGRLMDALHRRGLPVPAVLRMTDEPVVDGRPFYLLEAVDGQRIEQVVGTVPNERIAASAVDVLKRLQQVPVAESGIGDETPASLEFEIGRWTWLMNRAPEELTGQAPAVAGLLDASKPAERPPVLVHADFHYGNMLFRDGGVVALLDWEIAQLGQPLLDLACLAVVAQASRSGTEQVPGGGAVAVPDELLLDLYGADPGEFGWYLAFTYYKYAAIFGYNLMLHRRGKRPDPTYETRTTTIVDFIAEAHRLLGAT